MKINKDSLSARIQKISKEKEIDSTLIYSRFFFDSFLIRLSKSQYADKFILKGGLLLSSVLGIENRATIDMDFLLKKINMNRESVVGIIADICTQPTDDDVFFEYLGCSTIKKDDAYGGFSITLEGRFQNIRQQFDIDLAVGDTIYPSNLTLNHECLITKEHVNLKCYSMESIMAEKMQAFLNLRHLNSRSKDIYDLYILEKFELNDENKDAFKTAFKLTCENRAFKITKQEALTIFEEYLTRVGPRARWEAYSKKAKYSCSISFDEAMASVKKLIMMFYE